MKLKVWLDGHLNLETHQEKEVDVVELVKEFKAQDKETARFIAKDAKFIKWLAYTKNYSWDVNENVKGNLVWDAIYDELYGKEIK